MKKIFFILTLIFTSVPLLAQDEYVYIILTSRPVIGDYITEDGIYKFVSDVPNNLHNSSPISFSVVSPGREIEEKFYHADYNIDRLRADRARHNPNTDPEILVKSNEIMDTQVKPRSFLNTITPIDLDALFPTMTEESLIELLRPLWGKKLYIIDRNDITADSITLIGAKYTNYQDRHPTIEELESLRDGD